MADSESSTTPAVVTRRHLLAGVAATAGALSAGDGCPESKAQQTQAGDLAVRQWQRWLEAHRRTTAACHTQQRLEEQLARTVGFPRVPDLPPDEGGGSCASLDGGGGRGVGSELSLKSPGAETGADLAAHRARWEEEDVAIGYSVAKREEEAAAEQERTLAEELKATPASTLAGVAAKLDAILRQGEWCEACPEFPWPEIRSALEDLVRIGKLHGFEANHKANDNVRAAGLERLLGAT